ncbi:MAG: phosphate ABC transporter ATP-binding protein, partial [Burkholderiales bacterium]|nr:phosphate ABC transporter ATP-binding protein [Burkholderiales bacterium]
DPGARREVETLIDEFARDGMTVVFSSHNLGQAKRLATRVAYLEAGRLVVERPVQEFFEDELPPQAAAFLKGELPWIG